MVPGFKTFVNVPQKYFVFEKYTQACVDVTLYAL